MKTMKKLLCALVGLSLVSALSACARTGPDASGGAKRDGETIDVGIVQLIDNGAFEDMREGFIQRMRDQGYDESKMTFHYSNAQGDSTNLNTICQELVDSEMDLVVAIATPAAQAMVNLDSDIPVFFISVSDPVGARIVTNMDSPDKNATGTSNAIPVGEIFELADQLTPGYRSVGLLYNTGETNSVSTVAAAERYLESRDVSCVEALVANSSEVQQAAQSLVGRVDAIFVPNDSVVQSAMALVAEVAREAGIPIYCSSTTTVQSGALATRAISDPQIGAITADMAIRYLTGTPIQEIPVQVVPATDVVINKTTAQAIGVTVPDVLSQAILVEG